jgi:hypothetical protein
MDKNNKERRTIIDWLTIIISYGIIALILFGMYKLIEYMGIFS